MITTLLLFIFSLNAFSGLVPDHQVIDFEQGGKLYYFKTDKVPLFQIEIIFQGGALLDSDDKLGSVNFLLDLVSRGTKSLNEKKLNEWLDDRSGSVDFSVGADRTFVSIYGMNKHAAELVWLAFEFMKSARLDSEVFNRLLTNKIQRIKQYTDRADVVAEIVTDRLLYNGRLLFTPTAGLLSTIENISLDDLRSLYKSLFQPQNINVLLIGGDEAALQVLKKEISNLQKLKSSQPEKIDPQKKDRVSLSKWQTTPGKVILIDRPGIDEAHIRLGLKGPKRKIPEYYSLRLAEAILSGPSLSRIKKELRENRSLSYAVDADFDFGRETGSMNVSASTHYKKTTDFLDRAIKLLQNFIKPKKNQDFVSSKELREGKDYLKGTFLLGFQSVYSIASSFFSGINNGLPAEFIDVYRPSIDAVKIEDIHMAMQKYYDLKDLQIIIVGDKNKIIPMLVKKGYAFAERKSEDFL